MNMYKVLGPAGTVMYDGPHIWIAHAAHDKAMLMGDASFIPYTTKRKPRTMNTPIAEEYRQQAEALARELLNTPHLNGGYNTELKRFIPLIATALQASAEAGREQERAYKDAAYSERNKLVRLLASLYPSGIKQTVIEGWDDDWHWCVYIDMPNGQASWHFHISDLPMFANLPAYAGEWDGHSTEQKYANILALAAPTYTPRNAQQSEAVIASALGNHLAVVKEGEDHE